MASFNILSPYSLNNSLSKSSVILPPYYTSQTIYLITDIDKIRVLLSGEILAS